MDARTAEVRFKEADTLYRAGKYDEALDCLIELDDAFPSTPNIMFPLARCLRRVGRADEALAICDDLVTRCSDLRAFQLREYIRKESAGVSEPPPLPVTPSLEGLNQNAHAGALDDLLSRMPLPAPGPAAANGSRRKYWYVGGAVAAVILIVALPLAMRTLRGPAPVHTESAAPRQTAELETGAPTSSAAAPASSVESGPHWVLSPVGELIFGSVISVAVFSAALYLTLRVAGKLPYDAVLDNIINTTFMGVAVVLLSCIPCLGLIFSIVLLYKSYELTIIEFFILFGFNVTAALFLFGLIFAGAFAFGVAFG